MPQTLLIPFLEKYWLLLWLVLVVIACARIISIYDALSLTADEPIHLACGMEYIASHTYALEAQHPPLSRALQALGPYLAGLRPAGMPDPQQEGLAILAHSRNFDQTVFLMRLGNLPFFLLACCVVAAWARHCFGKAVAVLATALFTLLPTVLADAGLAITDMALGATVAVAFLAALWWAERPTALRALLAGFSTALALLSKFTALGYVPISLGLALLCYVDVHRLGWRDFRQLARLRMSTFLLGAASTVLFVWAAYGFSYGVVPGKTYSLPAPDFFAGISAAMTHVHGGHQAFLLGESRNGGWWFYYPVALLVKLPIAFLLLAALGVWVCIRQRARAAYLFPLAFCAGILLPAMYSPIDIGIRHIEPIYIGLSMVAALGLVRLLQEPRFRVAPVLGAGALVLWMIVSGAIHHPDYLAYFNGFAGKHPENILVDSNYDWGQDLKFLARRLRQLDAKEVAMASLDGVRRYDYMQSWYGLPKIKTVDAMVPAAGWNVISPTVDKSFRERMLNGATGIVPWYDQVPPTERVGPLFLYYIAPGTENRFSRHSPTTSAPIPAGETH